MAADLPAVAVAVRDLYQRRIAAALGLVWIVGRILYVIGYAKAAAKRGPGFAIQAVATIALWVGSLGAILWRVIHA